MPKRYASVWDALIDDPGEKESYKIKSRLMMSIEQYIKNKGLTQEKAAELMGVSQPKISNVVNGKFNKITIDLLIKMLVKVGAKIDFSINASTSTHESIKGIAQEAKTEVAVIILHKDATRPVGIEKIYYPSSPVIYTRLTQNDSSTTRY